MYKLTVALFCLVQAAFGASYYNRQYYAAPQYQQYQAVPYARQIQATPFSGQADLDNFINEWSDFDFSRLTNLGVSGLGGLTEQLKTMLPASGNVVTDNGSGPVVNTKFGAFPLQSYSMIPEGFRKEFLPVLKALVAVFEKEQLDPADANLLLSLSRDLTNKLPTPAASGTVSAY